MPEPVQARDRAQAFEPGPVLVRVQVFEQASVTVRVQVFEPEPVVVRVQVFESVPVPVLVLVPVSGLAQAREQASELELGLVPVETLRPALWMRCPYPCL